MKIYNIGVKMSNVIFICTYQCFCNIELKVVYNYEASIALDLEIQSLQVVT